MVISRRHKILFLLALPLLIPGGAAYKLAFLPPTGKPHNLFLWQGRQAVVTPNGAVLTLGDESPGGGGFALILDSRGRSPGKENKTSDSTPTCTRGFLVTSWPLKLRRRSPGRPRCPRLTLGVTFTARSGYWRLLLLRQRPERPLSSPTGP